ncbi:Mitogen-activated protein kinase-binding protein 1 [Saguinus oedipus]|uniref:Mitogen-activated protein kinase-binding protein 1 n=1 Tax=Saguinus oedipus TaxID=9490 RepID=A0ABQ9V5P3_SAGOE|nr:Mitogen-activated protein kinase-binding protein 1 [Saguinus oedipus]
MKRAQVFPSDEDQKRWVEHGVGQHLGRCCCFSCMVPGSKSHQRTAPAPAANPGPKRRGRWAQPGVELSVRSMLDLRQLETLAPSPRGPRQDSLAMIPSGPGKHGKQALETSLASQEGVFPQDLEPAPVEDDIVYPEPSDSPTMDARQGSYPGQTLWAVQPPVFPSF